MIMKKATVKDKIFWAVGSVVALSICYLLSHEDVFGQWHGMKQWPLFLFLFGAAVIFFASFGFFRKVMICTPVGYILGFVMAMIFNNDYPLYNQGVVVEIRNNAWQIWAVTFIVMIAVSVVWEIGGKLLKRKLFLLICVVCFTACGSLSEGEGSDHLNMDSSTSETDDDSIYEIEAIALNENGGSLLFYTLSGINSSLASVNTNNAELTALDGTRITADDFITGQLVIITYDGMIAESYPEQILKCYKIRIVGESDDGETANALEKYREVHTTESVVYYVNTSGTLEYKTVSVIFGDYFGEWKRLNNVPEDVTSLKMFAEDNAYDETNGETIVHHTATVRDYHLDLSSEFLPYLASVTDEQLAVSSLVKTIIGNNPPAADTAVFLTVNGNPLITEKNDFSKRLK